MGLRILKNDRAPPAEKEMQINRFKEQELAKLEPNKETIKSAWDAISGSKAATLTRSVPKFITRGEKLSRLGS